MIHSVGRQFDRDRRRILLLVLPLLVVCLSSCGQSRWEVNEALRLSSTLKRLAPEATDLLAQEHKTANDLKITLDESGGGSVKSGTPEFRQRVNADLDSLSEIRARRLDIQQTVGQGIWRSPMVQAVQHDAVAMLQDEITQDDDWILYVRNLQRRAELGRQDVGPEYNVLIRELGAFVLQVDEPPLSVQLRNLIEEFRFSESEVRP